MGSIQYGELPEQPKLSAIMKQAVLSKLELMTRAFSSSMFKQWLNRTWESLANRLYYGLRADCPCINSKLLKYYRVCFYKAPSSSSTAMWFSFF